jgi:hypothetical protein
MNWELFTGRLPEGFSEWPPALYQGQGLVWSENSSSVESFITSQLPENEVYILHLPGRIRLVAIFPAAGETAQFAYFESVNDPELNHRVFDSLRELCQEKGYTELEGPVHFSTFFRYRLRLGGVPSWKQFDREPINPDYYPTLLEQSGFFHKLTYESRKVQVSDVPVAFRQHATLLEALKVSPFEAITPTPETWDALLPEVYGLIMATFGQNPGFRAIPFEAFALHYSRTYAEGLCPFTSVIFREKFSGKMAALSLTQPDYFARTTDLHLTPNFHRDLPGLAYRTLLIRTVGVHPDFRKQGVMYLLGAYGLANFSPTYQDAIFCLMRSDNPSLRFSDVLPVEKAVYALFHRSV